jgi:sterol desaturase/sphingolipid hydroxylase (fatty acid hydroxylase superfamily)
MNLDAKVYWTLFSAALAAVALWEVARPWRAVSGLLVRRWRNHGVLLLIYGAFLAVAFRGSSVLVALAVQHSRFGLLNLVPLTLPARVVLGILFLDLFRYLEHRLFHSVPLLWRVHQVHHSDADIDLSTGVRHHPFENMLSLAFSFATIVLLAPPTAAVLTLEIISVVHVFFSHANANFPPRFEGLLRLVLITPEMHRIHHSDEMRDQNANLGELFPWWDRLFGTYLDAPVAGLERVRIGLRDCDESEAAGLLFMLAQPLRSAPEPASIPEGMGVRISGD